QRKETNNDVTAASTQTEDYINTLSGGKPLSKNERSFFEPRMGYDFSDVKIHTDSMAAKSARSINALAYTMGNNIIFNVGQYTPDTDAGKRLLAHELTHTSQQGGAAIKKTSTCPTSSCPGIAPSASNCGKYWANSWWLPLAYANNATLACLETPNEPTANCVRQTLQDRLDGTPSWLKALAASQKGLEVSNYAAYAAFVQSSITPIVYADHVFAYRTAGCPSGPALYPAWIGVTTVPMPPGTVGWSIRYGGGSCSGTWGSWC
ncbi:MAG: DUF4157 domain-containing protein, partial [Bacteroidota bacterium]|nr:DUF4157 domain-containing protein [Bacteroidota bacterium]